MWEREEIVNIKYKNEDYVYVKYDIKMYSDSGRTKLVDLYSEHFAERYR